MPGACYPSDLAQDLVHSNASLEDFFAGEQQLTASTVFTGRQSTVVRGRYVAQTRVLLMPKWTGRLTCWTPSSLSVW
jgi:hypothetical protein